MVQKLENLPWREMKKRTDYSTDSTTRGSDLLNSTCIIFCRLTLGIASDQPSVRLLNSHSVSGNLLIHAIELLALTLVGTKIVQPAAMLMKYINRSKLKRLSSIFVLVVSLKKLNWTLPMKNWIHSHRAISLVQVDNSAAIVFRRRSFRSSNLWEI